MLAVPIGLGLAIFLNQIVFGIRLIKSLFFFPFVISQVVIGLIFTWFYLTLVQKLFLEIEFRHYFVIQKSHC